MNLEKSNFPAAFGRLCLAATLAAAAACGDGGQAAQGGAQGGASPFGGGRNVDRVFTVAVAPVELGSIARVVTVSGVVEPIRTIAVNSQLAGALRSVNVQEGDVVSANAVLARFDDRELAAQVASAEASHQLAQANYQRAERLRERAVITSAEYERDRAAAAAAAAQLEQLRTRLEHATIRSPIAGIVTEKRVETGDVVASQMRLFTLADVSTMVVRVQVSELDVVDLATGDGVTVALDAFPGRIIAGRIRRIFPAADPSTRLVPVEVALTGEGARLARSGFLARVTFKLNPRDGVRLVPTSAVVRGTAGAEAVFIVRDGRAHRRDVRTGVTSEGRIEIVSGVEAGEIVVVTGNNALRDGADVRIVGNRVELSR